MRIVVSTCDKYNWALRPFAYLFNTYWDALQPVVVAGYTPPEFELPPNFIFTSIDDHDYPMNKWSDGIIKFLGDHFHDDYFIWLLDDYWLCEPVNVEAVNKLALCAMHHPGVVRMDLTSDRQYNGMASDIDAWMGLDIVETPPESPYQMSIQAAVWKRQYLLKLLKPGCTAWQTEISTRPPANMRVLGSKCHPVRYANAFKGGNPGELLNLDKIPTEHIEFMKGQGWIIE